MPLAVKSRPISETDRMEQLERENVALKARLREAKSAVTLKVSAKGGLSIYGLGNRFPVTLYKGQWREILARSDEIDTFLTEHDDELKDKEGLDAGNRSTF